LRILSSLTTALIALAAFTAGAQPNSDAASAVPPAGCPEVAASNAFLGISTIRLWSGDAPEAKGSACDDIPTLSVLRPQPGRENGSAVVVMPGGAYLGLAAILEGREVADWFASRGFTAFVLRYRLGKKYLLPVPLVDARRAVQLVRARANDYHIDPNRIGVIGFSAGGHLAGLSGTQFVPGKPEAEDPIERVSSRPDFLMLGYPWIGAISPNTEHLTYCKLVNVMDRCDELLKAYSPSLFVRKDTPPTFIYHTTEDKTVPVEQALSFYDALLKAGVSSEMHIFAKGAHGSGLGSGDNALDQWPALLEAWLRAQGLLTRATP
jgi:acetyl esterase/lipase